jgi:hypothetical protein
MKKGYLIILMTINMLNGWSQNTAIDSTIISTDSTTINGSRFIAIYRTDEFLYVLDSKNNVVLKSKDYYPDFEFTDFDNDGNEELMINYLSNVPAIKDLIKYNPTSNLFVPIENFSNFPDPKPITGTKYFYSYHRSGCADRNWDSDLFFIENYKTIKVGNIAGRECDNIDEKDGIYIYKVLNGEKEITNTLPIERIKEFEDTKWGFILDFWTKNYNDFK